jgi:hypothetical protein
MPSGNQLEALGDQRYATVTVRRTENTKYSQLDLLLGIVDRVRTMADIATDSKRKITTNRACFGGSTQEVWSRLTHDGENKRNDRRTGSRSKRVSCAKHHTASLDGIEALPDHGDDGARSHVLDKTREERLILQVLVVCTKKERQEQMF